MAMEAGILGWVRRTYLVSWYGSDCLHHCQGHQVLDERNSLAQVGMQRDGDVQSAQGTAQGTEPSVPTTTWAGRGKRATSTQEKTIYKKDHFVNVDNISRERFKAIQPRMYPKSLNGVSKLILKEKKVKIFNSPACPKSSACRILLC